MVVNFLSWARPPLWPSGFKRFSVIHSDKCVWIYIHLVWKTRSKWCDLNCNRRWDSRGKRYVKYSIIHLQTHTSLYYDRLTVWWPPFSTKSLISFLLLLLLFIEMNFFHFSFSLSLHLWKIIYYVKK